LATAAHYPSFIIEVQSGSSYTPPNHHKIASSLEHHAQAGPFLGHASTPFFSSGKRIILISGLVYFPENVPALAADADRLNWMFDTIGYDIGAQLEGWFLVVCWDVELQSLYVINNAYSNALAYYSATPRGIILASDLCSLLSTLPAKPSFDRSSLLNFLNNGYNHSEHTPFEHMLKLHAGHCLSYTDGRLTVRPYEELAFPRAQKLDMNGALDTYHQTFSQYARNTMAQANTPVACAISGGLDTSWTLYHSAEAASLPVEAYTVWFGHPQFDELQHARLAAQICQAHHTSIRFTPQDLDLIVPVVAAAQEPVLSVSLPIYKMMQTASQSCSKIVMGEGGNNIFSIYYPVAEAHRYLSRIPSSLVPLALKTVTRLAEATGVELLWAARHVMKIYAQKGRGAHDYFRELSCHYHFCRSQRETLMDPGLFQGLGMHRSSQELPLENATFFDDLIRMNIVYALRPYLLFFEHKFAKALGIEVAAPFVSRNVLKFASSLPMDLIVGGSSLGRLRKSPSSDRPFQKAALARIYPASHVHRRPQLFYAPYHDLLLQRPQLLKALKKALHARGWYRTPEINRLFEELPAQKQHATSNSQFQNHGYRIMALLSAEVWARLFLDRTMTNPQSANQVNLEELLTLP